MNPLLAIFHFSNFIAPALVLAVLMVICGHLFFREAAKARGWIAPIAIQFVAGCAVLVAGLWWFGNDGKMATYAALAVGAATVQWILLK